jgi:hypothetical protein
MTKGSLGIFPKFKEKKNIISFKDSNFVPGIIERTGSGQVKFSFLA